MKVLLRISPGIVTGKIHMPDRCLHTQYRVPYTPKASLHFVNGAQDIMQKEKIMIFQWDEKSNKLGTPILDLIDIE